MKEKIRNRFATYFAIYLILVLITGIFARHLRFLKASPEFFLLFLVAFSIHRGAVFGVVFGFFSGLFLDFASLFLVGSQSLIFTTLGYSAGLLSKKLYTNFFQSQIFLVIAVSLLRWISNYFLGEIFGVKYALSLSWLALTLFYNLIITAPVFFIAEKIDLKMRETKKV